MAGSHPWHPRGSHGLASRWKHALMKNRHLRKVLVLVPSFETITMFTTKSVHTLDNHSLRSEIRTAIGVIKDGIEKNLTPSIINSAPYFLQNKYLWMSQCIRTC